MIEYVTKNEETDELELKPISYGIPEIASKEDPTALDYENAVSEPWNINTQWTATKRGVVFWKADIIDYQIRVLYIKKDGTTLNVCESRSTGSSYQQYTFTFIVSPGETYQVNGNGNGGPGPGGLTRTFIPFKVQYE